MKSLHWKIAEASFNSMTLMLLDVKKPVNGERERGSGGEVRVNPAHQNRTCWLGWSLFPLQLTPWSIKRRVIFFVCFFVRCWWLVLSTVKEKWGIISYIFNKISVDSVRPQGMSAFFFFFFLLYNVLTTLVISISCFTDAYTGEFSQWTVTPPCLLFIKTLSSIRQAEAGT